MGLRNATILGHILDLAHLMQRLQGGLNYIDLRGAAMDLVRIS
jgi:hypothetical protein